MIISSQKNEGIKFVKSLLADKKVRKKHGLFVAEGINFVCDSLDKSTLTAVYYTAQAAKREKVVEFLRVVDCPCYEVTDDVMRAASDTVSPSGLLALARVPENGMPTADKVIILDGVTDPGNIGTIIRSAAAFGFGAVIAGEETDFYSPNIVRSTMTGLFAVQLYNAEIPSVLSELSAMGYYSVALDMNGADIAEIEKRDKIALIVGSEAHGISDVVRNNADLIASIPMSDKVESLNAAIAAAVAMYAVVR